MNSVFHGALGLLWPLIQLLGLFMGLSMKFGVWHLKLIFINSVGKGSQHRNERQIYEMMTMAISWSTTITLNFLHISNYHVCIRSLYTIIFLIFLSEELRKFRNLILRGYQFFNCQQNPTL